jgi:hypothetical protein
LESLGSFKYRIISSTTRDNLTSSFPICIPFISVSRLIALAKNYNTILSKNGESEHPCFIPEFRGNGFSFSLLRIMLAIWLAYISFNILRYVPSIHTFFKAFTMKGYWILSKFVLHLLRWTYDFCPFFCLC